MENSDLVKTFEQYLMLRKFSLATVGSYIGIINKFIGGTPECPSRITSSQIAVYVLKIENARTRNQTIGCLKTFFKIVVKRPNVVNTPYAKVPSKTPVFITKEQFEQGMSKCPNHKHRLIFRLAFSHGLRLGEILNCRVGWFGSQVVEGVKHFTLNVTGKGSKDRLIWISKGTANELALYAKKFKIDLTNKNQYLLSGQVKEKYSGRAIQQLTQKYFGINPHALRHGFATELMNKDVNQKKIQDLLGHASSKTTEIYSHTSIRSIIGVSA